MKKVMCKTIYGIVILAALNSCGGADVKTEKSGAPDKTAAQSSSSQLGKTASTVAEVKAVVQKDWKSVDGQEVIVTAYPAGMEKQSKNGEFLLYLSDSKDGSDLNFAASFKEEMREQVKTHKGGILITVTGNIKTPNGIIALKNAKIAE